MASQPSSSTSGHGNLHCLEIQSFVRGYHAYTGSWTLVSGETIDNIDCVTYGETCKREPTNLAPEIKMLWLFIRPLQVLFRFLLRRPHHIFIHDFSSLFPLRMHSRSWPQEHMVLQDLTKEVVNGKQILVLLEYLFVLDKYESVS